MTEWSVHLDVTIDVEPSFSDIDTLVDELDAAVSASNHAGARRRARSRLSTTIAIDSMSPASAVQMAQAKLALALALIGARCEQVHRAEVLTVEELSRVLAS